MSIFNVLYLVGGLALFLFGMCLMGQALERRAGNGLRTMLGRLTTNKFLGLLTGMGVTSVIQSSSATTVMVVGFVNSGIMSLKQSINVIMGANIGTTVTAWILSLAGIDSSNFFVRLLKPSSFTPILAVIGVILYMFFKSDKKKDTGVILLGFATLMFGMEQMSGAVSCLKDIPEFTRLFLLFSNPLLGVLAGALLTAIIQSSSASVGILQALALTGGVTYSSAIPIIMGQNIGTCVTALISSVGTNKNAKRAALVHLSFNVIGTTALLAAFCIIKPFVSSALLGASVSPLGMAVIHTAFNVLCTIIMFPASGLLEKLVCRIVPDSKVPEKKSELDERLLAAPSVALHQCVSVMQGMVDITKEALSSSLSSVFKYDGKKAEKIKNLEDQTDHYEDVIGTYLVKLSSQKINQSDSMEASCLLKLIGDFERIADHSVSISRSSCELNDKSLLLSDEAKNEWIVLSKALSEIFSLAYTAFSNRDCVAAQRVEPLRQVISGLKEEMRTRHILRLQQNTCSVNTGFIWSDILTDAERISDHCSNIAGCIIDAENYNMNTHEALRTLRTMSESYRRIYDEFCGKYALPR